MRFIWHIFSFKSMGPINLDKKKKTNQDFNKLLTETDIFWERGGVLKERYNKENQEKNNKKQRNTMELYIKQPLENIQTRCHSKPEVDTNIGMFYPNYISVRFTNLTNQMFCRALVTWQMD